MQTRAFFYMNQNYIANPKGNKSVKKTKRMICEKSIYHVLVSLAAIGQKYSSKKDLNSKFEISLYSRFDCITKKRK